MCKNEIKNQFIQELAYKIGIAFMQMWNETEDVAPASI